LADLLRQVRQTIDQHDLFVTGDRVVVGVSGGPDSLCLLHVLQRLRKEVGYSICVAHLNHGARGGDSRADARFVRSIAEHWNLPVTVEDQDVPALAREHGTSFEETARRVRYAFLARVALERGARKIAVGHNADDQSETVLMHFLRGSGPAGLRGMLPITPISDYRLLAPFLRGVGGEEQLAALSIVRPLIDVPRSAIEQYCAENGLRPRFDRSNLDVTYFRNRLRRELLPLLETYNPGIRQRLRHTAAVVAADYELLAGGRAEAWSRVVGLESGSAIEFDLPGWRQLPVSLQRSVLRQAVYQLRHTLRDVSFSHIEAARLVALRGRTGDQATLPKGLMLTVDYDGITLASEGDIGTAPCEPLLVRSEAISVRLPGVTKLPGGDWVLRAEILQSVDCDLPLREASDWTIYLDADALTRPLDLRPRRPGDRFEPQGMGGHSVKVSDFMVNVKVPRAWRDRVPLLVSAGRIAWVCGRRVGERFLVSDTTRTMVRLSFEQVGGVDK